MHMIVLATGSTNRPDLLAPHVDDEMRVLGQLKAEGVIKSAYRCAAAPGVDVSLRAQGSTPYENGSTSSLWSSRAA